MAFMKTTKDGWELSIRILWQPIESDVKESCGTCRGTGKDIFMEDNCNVCGGNGFKYLTKGRGEKPEVPKHLVQWMRDAYKEWEELYGQGL